MGGKGGGGDGGEGRAAMEKEWDLTTHPGYFVNRTTGEVLDHGYNTVGHKDTMWPEAQPVQAAAPAPAAPAPEPAAPAPVVEAPKPVEAIGPPISSGGAITQPTGQQNTGEVLGGSILNPPAYWVGNSGRTGRGTGSGTGSLRTTK